MARRKPKKKSGSGVWIGSAISVGVLLLIIGAFYLKNLPDAADTGTGGITSENLAVQSLPSSFPQFGATAFNEPADADALFDAAVDANRWVRGGFNDPEKPIQGSQAVIEQLVAAGAGELDNGFLDRQVPDKAFETPEVKQAMSSLAAAVKLHIDYHIEEAQFDKANGIAAAYLAFGRQTFENNLRLKIRQRGLLTMNSALQQLRKIATAAEQDGAIDEGERDKVLADVTKGLDTVKAIQDTWQSKLKSTESVSEGVPNISDLVKIAKEDKDRTFRIWAARRLGYALFERGDTGNQAAIKQALDELEQSDDKLVAEAAKAGRSIKDKAEYHELRK